MTVDVTYMTDPGCPWGYSSSPAVAVLRWRFGDQLRWRLVMIHISSGEGYVKRGFTPVTMVNQVKPFKMYGMPVAPVIRSRMVGTERACRAVVATRLQFPGREYAVLRALQLAWITSDALLDEDGVIAETIASVPGIDADAIVAALDSPAVDEAYAAELAEVRRAEGSPTHAMGRTATFDGPVRYTAPSLIFERDGRRLDAGGFQPLEAYDVCLANLAPDLERRPAAATVVEALQAFPDGLTTQEVAAIMTPGSVSFLDPTDRRRIEDALVNAVYAGEATRVAVGDDGLWRPAALVGAPA
jgi:predicted DsbA family dithiol-disulfide isomerase